MFKILLFILSFMKEFAFDKKEEMDITSTNFNFKKTVVYLSLVLSMAFNAMLIDRVAHIADKYFILEKQNTNLLKYKDISITNDETITKLKANYETCMGISKGKKD